MKVVHTKHKVENLNDVTVFYGDGDYISHIGDAWGFTSGTDITTNNVSFNDGSMVFHNLDKDEILTLNIEEKQIFKDGVDITLDDVEIAKSVRELLFNLIKNK